MTMLVQTLVCCMMSANMAAVQTPAPKGPPPKFVIVHDTYPAQGTIVLSTAKVYTEKYQVKQNVNVNGQVMERTQYHYRAVYQYDTLDAHDSCVMTPDGKQLPIDEVWKRLKLNTLLVVSGDGKRPASEFLRALSADTLVFIPAPPKK